MKILSGWDPPKSHSHHAPTKIQRVPHLTLARDLKISKHFDIIQKRRGFIDALALRLQLSNVLAKLEITYPFLVPHFHCTNRQLTQKHHFQLLSLRARSSVKLQRETETLEMKTETQTEPEAVTET